MFSRISPCLVAVFCAAVSACADVTYDAVADFSGSQNTSTSRWSYRYGANTVRNGNYSLLPTYAPLYAFGPADPSVWKTSDGTVPHVGVNLSGLGVHSFSWPAFTWKSGTMLVHPGYGSLVAVSWLSPVSSFININFSFNDLDPTSGPYLSDGVNWFVERNNSSATLTSGSFANGGASGIQNLSNIYVNAGDRINFIVDPKSAAEYDSTRLTATITVVPEPSLLSLFGLCLLGGLWTRSRFALRPQA